MLSQHLDIQWNKRLSRYEETSTGVTAFFEDGTSATGDMLVGADGLHSRGASFPFSLKLTCMYGADARKSAASC